MILHMDKHGNMQYHHYIDYIDDLIMVYLLLTSPL